MRNLRNIRGRNCFNQAHIALLVLVAGVGVGHPKAERRMQQEKVKGLPGSIMSSPAPNFSALFQALNLVDAGARDRKVSVQPAVDVAATLGATQSNKLDFTRLLPTSPLFRQAHEQAEHFPLKESATIQQLLRLGLEKATNETEAVVAHSGARLATVGQLYLESRRIVWGGVERFIVRKKQKKEKAFKQKSIFFIFSFFCLLVFVAVCSLLTSHNTLVVIGLMKSEPPLMRFTRLPRAVGRCS